MQKIALVTGASSGIGEAVAKALGAAGIYVLLVGRRVEELERVRSEITSGGGRADHFTAELSDPSAVEKLAAEVIAKIAPAARIDILVNAAGKFDWDAEVGSSVQAIAALCNANLISKMLLTEALRPLLLAAGNPRIVNIASHAADFPDTKVGDGIGAREGSGEVGYVLSMMLVKQWSAHLQVQNPEWKVIPEEPPLIDTPGARVKFTKKHLGKEVDWSDPAQAIPPDVFANKVISALLN